MSEANSWAAHQRWKARQWDDVAVPRDPVTVSITGAGTAVGTADPNSPYLPGDGSQFVWCRIGGSAGPLAIARTFDTSLVPGDLRHAYWEQDRPPAMLRIPGRPQVGATFYAGAFLRTTTGSLDWGAYFSWNGTEWLRSTSFRVYPISFLGAGFSKSRRLFGNFNYFVNEVDGGDFVYADLPDDELTQALLLEIGFPNDVLGWQARANVFLDFDGQVYVAGSDTNDVTVPPFFANAPVWRLDDALTIGVPPVLTQVAVGVHSAGVFGPKNFMFNYGAVDPSGEFAVLWAGYTGVSFSFQQPRKFYRFTPPNTLAFLSQETISPDFHSYITAMTTANGVMYAAEWRVVDGSSSRANILHTLDGGLSWGNVLWVNQPGYDFGGDTFYSRVADMGEYQSRLHFIFNAVPDGLDPSTAIGQLRRLDSGGVQTIIAQQTGVIFRRMTVIGDTIYIGGDDDAANADSPSGSPQVYAWNGTTLTQLGDLAAKVRQEITDNITYEPATPNRGTVFDMIYVPLA